MNNDDDDLPKVTQEFYAEMQSASLEQLISYKKGAILFTRGCTFLGVGTILLAVSYPSIFSIFFGGLLVYGLAYIGVQLDKLIIYVKGLIAKSA